MSNIKDLLAKLKAEAEGNAKWREVTVEEKRKAAERLIREAEILQNTAKADREEAAQCDLALRALESNNDSGLTADETKALTTFAFDVISATKAPTLDGSYCTIRISNAVYDLLAAIPRFLKETQ